MIRILIALLFLGNFINSQTIDRTGQGYFYWGYNRSFYGQSDIRIIGDGYDFTIYDVMARDRKTDWDPKIYFHPAKLTIPQFNFRLGYYLKSNLSVSFGWDHMKYVQDDYQVVNITGTIDEELSPVYGGTYVDGDRITLDPNNFLHIEHTDGLNYVRFNIDKHQELFNWWKDRIQMSLLIGAGTGVMMPQTDFTFLGQRTNNNGLPRIQGFAVSTNYGIKFDFFKHFYLQFIGHNGYINMPWVVTRGAADDRAKQGIWFIEYMGVFGAYFPIKTN